MARKQGPGGRKAALTIVQDVPGGSEPVELLGVCIDRLDREEALAAIEACVEARLPRQVATVNLDFLRLAGKQPEFARMLNEADLAVADGMPLVWASRVAGMPLPQRLAGVDLVDAICDRGSSVGWSVFLLGAGPEVADAAAAAIVRRHPGLRIAGVYSPPMGVWDDLEEKRIRDRIVEARPDVLFVALGAPRQDLWIAENKSRLGVPVSIGVGCTFDVMGGSKPRAPGWMQHAGLEWAFRLATEPGRLWLRYASDLPTFARLMFAAVRARLGGPAEAEGGGAP